ncbi:hypothetical protein [Azospirillum doebereinerae]
MEARQFPKPKRRMGFFLRTASHRREPCLGSKTLSGIPLRAEPQLRSARE